MAYLTRASLMRATGRTRREIDELLSAGLPHQVTGQGRGSEIQVLTQGGSVLYSRRLLAEDGNQLRWDGRNRAGRKVTEGIYFYTIRSPKDLKRGKLIVGR